MSARVQDAQLWEACRRVLNDMFRSIHEFQQSGTSAPRLSSYPVVRRNSRGRARIVRGPGPDGVFDYSIFFSANSSGSPKTSSAYLEVDGYSELTAYCISNDRIRAFLLPEDLRSHDGIREPWIANIPGTILLDIASRYLNTGGSHSEVNWGSVQEIYCEVEAWILTDELIVDVLVPIAGLTFHESRIDLEPGVHIERFDDDYAATVWPTEFPEKSYQIFGAATHCLVIKGQKIANQSFIKWMQERQDFPYPKAIIDRFFEAAHMVSELDPGYAQIVFRPVGWAPGYQGMRSPLVPGQLTGYRYFLMNDELDDETEDVRLFYRRLSECSNNMRVASERFRMAAQRDNDTDKIIDLCVALEALLGVDDRQEISYKLALRSAAVLAGNGLDHVDFFFSCVKQAYSYRSQVVHGASRTGKSTTIDVDGNRHPVTLVIERLLRALLRFSLRRGAMDGKIADNEFVIPALATYARSFNADT